MASNKQKNQQVIRTGNIYSREKVTIKQDMSVHDNTFSGDQRQRRDFINKLSQVITDLEARNNEIPIMEDAIDELQSAKAESEKSTPEGASIARFLRSAKGIIEDVAGSTLGIASIVKTIGYLINLVPNIFK